jgi:hypothetical protein
MTLSKMAFNPTDGLRNTVSYPSVPTDDAAAREQVQGRLDELQDFINDTLTAEVDAHVADYATLRNVKNYGVLGVAGGSSDDTVACNALEEGYTYVFPADTYMIKAHTDDLLGYGGFRPKANTKYIFLSGAKLKAITSPSDIYNVVWIDIADTEIYDIEVEGDSATHVSGGVGAYGYGINIRNNAKCKIYNPKTYNCWGDGIINNTLVGSDVEIYNPDSYNNRRQAMSLMCADRFRVKGGKFRNTSGANPQCGLDIEPNYATDILNDVVFEDIEFNDNAAAGITIYGGGAFPTEYKIEFKNCRTKGNAGFSTVIQSLPYSAKGSISFTNTKLKKNGMHIIDSFANVFIDNILCENTIYPFQIENTVADTVCGNLVAKNVQIIDEDATLLKAVSFVTSNTVTGNNIKDIDIDIVRHNLANTKITTSGDKKFLGKRSIKIDSVKDTTTSIFSSTMPTYLFQKIANTGATADITCEINHLVSRSLGATLEFEVVAAFYIHITDADTNILPFTGVRIRSNVVGSRIKLRYNGTNWVVVEQIGTWTVY